MIRDKILDFYTQTQRDEHHRFKSWEHCYAYFGNENADIEHASLHLAFYLASWGMYRGSGFLLNKDYLVHKEVTSHLLSQRNFRQPLSTIAHKNLTKDSFKDHAKKVTTIINWVKNWYQNNILLVNDKETSVNVTDTLASKIVLGTLGIIPAFDRFFIDGMRGESNKSLKFSSPIREHHIVNLLVFYDEHQAQFTQAQRMILKTSGINYPPMKLLDMYFWQLGYEKSIDTKSAK